jgi:hypothetical protein
MKTCIVCNRTKPAPFALPSGAVALLCAVCAKDHRMLAEAERRVAVEVGG